MHFTTTAAAVALLITHSAVFAAPANMKRFNPTNGQWTIESMKRSCNDDDTSCVYTFDINELNGNPVTNCYYLHNGTPASQTSGGPAQCGDFSVTSGWSNQYGDGNGFTTLAVTNNNEGLIAWPAYTDKQLVNDQTVSPDFSFPTYYL